MYKLRSCMIVFILSLLFSCNSSNHPKSSESKSDKQNIAKVIGTVSDLFIESTKTPETSHYSILVANSGNGYALIEPVKGKSRVVYNGVTDKNEYRMAGDLTISNDGKRVAYIAANDDVFKRVVENGVEGPKFIDIGMPKYSPDSKKLLYTITLKDSQKNEINYLAVDHKVNYNYQITQDFIISNNSQFVAVVSGSANDPKLILTDYSMTNSVEFDSCGYAYTANTDNTRIAAVCRDNDKSFVKVFDFNGRKEISRSNSLLGTVTQLKFSSDNRSIVYTMNFDNGKRAIIHNNRFEIIPKGDEFMSDPYVLDNNSVGVIAGLAYSMRFYKAFTKNAKEEKRFGFISDLVVSNNLKNHCYLAMNVGGSDKQHIVVNGNEGPEFDKIVSPVFSPHNDFVIYRGRSNGKRFIVIADLKGNTIRKLKEYAMVFQPEFLPDGKTFEYAALDGNKLVWIKETL